MGDTARGRGDVCRVCLLFVSAYTPAEPDAHDRAAVPSVALTHIFRRCSTHTLHTCVRALAGLIIIDFGITYFRIVIKFAIILHTRTHTHTHAQGLVRMIVQPCAALRTSAAFRALLKKVLDVGNRLNAGTNK